MSKLESISFQFDLMYQDLPIWWFKLCAV